MSFLLISLLAIFGPQRILVATEEIEPQVAGELQMGLLDVTKAPYSADPTGVNDCTEAIQRAVNDARHQGLACFFPGGTYLISETISCEQVVRKLDRPRYTDGKTQSYWDPSTNNRHVLMGSTKGERPTLKLAPGAEGFDDPEKPKSLVWIWAQTRDDAAGKQEPSWGKEQPNISFGHLFKGIDIDVRGHAGAIGIRHSGAQGSGLIDVSIRAEGAYAGFNNCPGHAGGTYNVEVRGGRYGFVVDVDCQHPILTACLFEGQTHAPIFYHPSRYNHPLVLVGCSIETAASCAMDASFSPDLRASLIDCVIQLKTGGVVLRKPGGGNLFMENVFVHGATTVLTDRDPIPAPTAWTQISLYSASRSAAQNLINGVVEQATESLVRWGTCDKPPAYAEIHEKHWSPLPSFEDGDAVHVTQFGAAGDGVTDDSEAFRKAIAASDKVFVPKGHFRVAGTLELKANTQLFGLSRNISSMGSGGSGRRGGGDGGRGIQSPTILTVDDPTAAPGVSLLGVRGRVEWRSGRGIVVFGAGTLVYSGNAGGRFYSIQNIGEGQVIEGTMQPITYYGYNVERVRANPQSVIRNANNVRIYYLKAEATVTGFGVGVAENTGNTPLAIINSTDVRVYCVNGNVTTGEQRPMVDIVDSSNVLISQAKSFRVGDFPQVRETHRGATAEIPSQRIAALLIRE